MDTRAKHLIGQLAGAQVLPGQQGWWRSLCLAGKILREPRHRDCGSMAATQGSRPI
jgi:hypothetical protein